MDKVRLGIVGAGRLGGFHASKAANNAEVEFVGVFDVCEANRQRVAQQFNVAEYASLSELLTDVDAVVVATPSVLHAEIGREILQSSKHLLMEKPVTTDGATALELARLAREKGLVFQGGHVEQHNPAWQAAFERLEEVRLGTEPVVIEAERTSGYTFRSTDVGATLDLMIHDLELVLSLIPSEVEHISAVGFEQLGGHEDVAFATLLFENGSVARFKASRIEQRSRRFMTIQTPTKTFQVDFGARSATLVRPKADILNGMYSPNTVSFAEMGPRVSTFMQDEYETVELAHEPVDALALEMQNFVSAILRGERSVVPGERAAQAVAIAEDIVRDLKRRSLRMLGTKGRKLRIAG